MATFVQPKTDIAVADKNRVFTKASNAGTNGSHGGIWRYYRKTGKAI